MAKSKRKRNKLLTYIKYGAILFAVVGIIMAVFSYVNYGDTAFSGFQVIFGYTGKASIFGILISTNVLSFSIVALLAIVLPLVGSFSIICKNKIVKLIGALMMIAGAVLCFLMPNFVVYSSDAIATAASLVSASLGVGAILSVVFFSLGALCNLYAVVEK